MIKKWNFPFDIKGTNTLPNIEVVQGDENSYSLNFSLMDNNLPVNLNGQNVSLILVKSDGKSVWKAFTITDRLNGEIRLILGEQEIACLGLVNAQIKIYGLNNELLTSTNFNFNVVGDLLSEYDVLSSNEWASLTTIMSNISQYDSKIANVESDLANMTSQVGTKAPQSELDTANSKITANTNSLLTKRDLSIKINSDDMDTSTQSKKIQPINVSDALMAMFSPAGSVSPMIPLKSVGIDKLAFNPVLGQIGKNIFNKASVEVGMYVSYLTGIGDANANYNLSEYIAIESNTDYIFNKLPGQLAFYDVNKAFISGVNGAWNFTSPSAGKYVRISVLKTDIDTFQCEKGIVSTNFEDYNILLKNDSVGTKNILAKSITADKYADKSISTGAINFDIINPVVGKNLLDKTTVTSGYYVNYLTGLLEAVATFSVSDFIKVTPNTQYIKYDPQQFAFYDKDKIYISGVASGQILTTPANCMYVRLSIGNPILDIYQLELGTVMTSYESYKKYLPNDVLVKKTNIEGVMDNNSDFKILLPSVIYITPGEKFSVYYANIIKFSQSFLKGNYYITERQKTESSYNPKGQGYDYKWEYTPVAGESDFEMEWRIVDTYTEEIIVSKVVKFIVASVKTGKTATTVILGDSFTDGYLITKYIHDFVTTRQANILNCVGLNDGGDTGVHDDAWGGEGYSFYYNSPTGYLRTDRPLSHAIWDAGWGENETNGWTTGQTYANLTETQKLHGFTKNEFYNPSTSLFDFNYYMSTYMSSQTIDSVVILAGLNDVIWDGVNTLKSILSALIAKIQYIVNSIKSHDSNIKIMLYTITPQTDDQNFFSTIGGNFKHYQMAKHCQELFNEALLDLYDNNASIADGIYVMPTSANFDSRFTGIKGDYYPDKFNPTYHEFHPYDIHPNSTGSQYIADTVYNYLYGLALK
ncbi:SGNH/GDSL hydrolase family protein [Clostridium estertheticum]|uniref:SGNH/GDSL hydrolase family protein n=1 Tax=Clostridium estertheticum TaxID=238834 RepID=UPI001C0B8F30|nr:SGNH/GDSL hydrolase family protein [Clostridium estertheticum]MBU3186664.1 BppU family phage baseplate upper protein [Clostridium estertheticum]